MRYIYVSLIAGAVAIVLVFVFQNTVPATVSLFSASVTLPVSLLVLLAYALGIVTGGVVVSLLRTMIHGAAKKQSRV